MLYFAVRSPWILVDKVMWFGSRNLGAALHPVLRLAFHGEFFLFMLSFFIKKENKFFYLFIDSLPLIFSIAIPLIIPLFVSRPGFIG
jgi:hypothetical protein